MPGVPLRQNSTSAYFASLPPFPKDIQTAPLVRISLLKLLSHDTAESQRVLEACQTRGFFYLDLSEVEQGRQLEEESEQLVEVAKAAFSLSFEEKVKYKMGTEGSNLAGYKPAGSTASTDPAKKADTTEFFNLAKDHLHAISPSRSYPPPITAAIPLCASFATHAHAVGLTVLAALATQLSLPADTFSKVNTFTKPSGDHIRLTKKIPHNSDDKTKIGLTAHTDFGSITILFNWLGGLQIKSKSSETLGEWEYVKPLAGHAIINLGDAMVKFTSGTLTSAKHRVVPAPGGQAEVERYSVVYFVRPIDETELKAIYGSEVGKEEKIYKAKEWIELRLKELQSDLFEGKVKEGSVPVRGKVGERGQLVGNGN